MRILKLAVAAAAFAATLAALPAQAQELLIWMRTNAPAEDKSLRQVMSEFEAANPGVKVKLETRSTDEHKSALRIASQSKSGPDLYYMWAGLGLGGEFVKAGLSANLDDYYKKYGWNDKLRPLANAYTSLYPPGKHGVPYTIRSQALYYNKELFKKAGITDLPKTYPELIAAADKLKKAGIPAITFGGSVNWHVMRLMDVLLETKCGAKTHDELKSMARKWADTPCATETFKEFHKWISEYTLKPFMSYDQAQSRKLFIADRAAMMLEGDWMSSQLRGESKTPYNFSLFPFPTGTSRIYGFGVNFFINPNGKKDLAAKFMDYFLTDKVQQTHLGSFGPLSVVNVQPQNPDELDKTWIELYGKFNATFVNGDQGFPLDVTTEYFRVINEVASDTLDPAKAAATLQAFIDKRR